MTNLPTTLPYHRTPKSIQVSFGTALGVKIHEQVRSVSKEDWLEWDYQIQGEVRIQEEERRIQEEVGNQEGEEILVGEGNWAEVEQSWEEEQSRLTLQEVGMEFRVAV
jgi:hypothetical protein